MASKLTDITASYHSFKKDQVLTEAQLNEFLDYFEDQGRLSRILLSGVGNICGFNVDTASDPQQVYISQGCGLSTDGDLFVLRNNGSKEGLKNIDLPGMVYTNYKVFTDEHAHYPAFLKDGSQLPIWELITAEEAGTDGTPPPLFKDFPNPQNMVAVLYMECYEDEADLCEGLSCDAQGVHQVARLRVLIMAQQDADYVLQQDTLFTKHDLMATYLQMKDLAVQRVLVTSKNAATIATLVNSYNISNEAQLVKDLQDGLSIMKNKLDPYYPNNPIKSIQESIDAKLPVKTPSASLYFQYRYDLLRDVVDTYNELKELFIRVSTECFPSITAFPKHLFIGKLQPQEEDLVLKRYRHDFYRSPILDDRSPEYGAFVAALQRLDEQLKAYPQLPETSTNVQLFESQLKLNSQLLAEKDLKIKRGQGLYRNEIKITPSRYRTTLGNKAIPFYYNVGLSLLKAWNSDKTANGKYRRNMAYDKTLLDPAANIQTPLLFNLEQADFFRIEGHQGHDYKEALETINTIRNTNGLSFDTKVIGIDVDKSIIVDTTNYSAEFEDLSVLLNAWVLEQECNLGSVTSLVSAYSLKEPGRNLKEEIYTPRNPIVPILREPTPGPGEVLSLLNENDPAGVGGSAETVETPGRLSSGLRINLPLSSIDPATSQQQKSIITANKNTFGSTSVVLESLTTDKNAVGYAFLQAVESNIRGSATDFITEANFHATAIINELDLGVWNPEKYVSIVDNTLQILAHSHVLSNSIPTSIGAITDEVIANYNTNINNLCVNLKRVQVTLATSSATALNEKNRGILNLLVAQLSSICCASKQLQTLLTEIDRRKDAILERLTLRKFAEEHPGLEHTAGVLPGGTFVMVYLKKGLSVQGAVSNTPNGTVVADFSLPYMCCSDVAPINFIIPRAPVKLRLDTDVYCLGDMPGALFFEVEPADGVIKADKEIDGMTIVGTVLSIDPSKIPTSALDQIIHFTVNDQITNTQLKLVKPINAFFEVPESPVTDTNIQFLPIGDFPDGTKFLWNFGDGTTSTEKLVYHQFKLPVNEENKVTVTLTVTPANGACPTIDKHDISFEEVTINLTTTVFCINDDTEYEFDIQPKGAKVTISGPGVINNGTAFVPSKSRDTGEIQFFLNGNPSLKVTVNPIPVVYATGTLKEGLVSLNGQVTSQDFFSWQFESEDGDKIHSQIDNQLSVLLPLQEFDQTYVQPGSTFIVKLVADNGCGSAEYSFALTVPANNELCNADARTDVTNMLENVKKVISGDVFSKLTEGQRDLYQRTAEYLTKVLDDPKTYFDGSQNNSVVSFTASNLNKIKETIHQITLRTLAQKEPMVNLYNWLSESFFSIVQCQEEGMFKTVAINSMKDVILSHLSPKISTSSFASSQIDIDPKGDYQAFVAKLLEYRSKGTQSYLFIVQVLDVLAAYYGGGILNEDPGPGAPEK